MNRLRFCACLLFATVAALPSFAADAAEPTHEKKEAPVTISRGQEIVVEDHLVTGKTTIFEFTTRFDAKCRTMSKHLDKLHAKRNELAVVRVDINRPEIKGADWSSPVAQQFELHALPAFIIYDAEGKQMADGKKASSLVDKWINR